MAKVHTECTQPAYVPCGEDRVIDRSNFEGYTPPPYRVNFRGYFDPTIPNPPLSDLTGNLSDQYRVSAAGVYNFGSGNVLSLEPGDMVQYDGSKWFRYRLDPPIDKDTWLANRTIKHQTIGTLSLLDTVHKTAEVQILSTGDVSLSSANCGDDFSCLLVNETSAQRTLNLIGFSSAYRRDGNTITNLNPSVPLPANSTSWITVTTDGGHKLNVHTAGGGGGSYTPPDYRVDFLGYHNANSNSPTLSDATGSVGDQWRISVGATRDYGSGSLELMTGDLIQHDGTRYFRIPTTPTEDIDTWVANRTTVHAAASNYIVMMTDNTSEIHLASSDAANGLSLDANDLDDSFTALVVNTSDTTKTITLLNYTGAFIRDGGAVTNLNPTVQIPGNVSFWLSQTEEGSDKRLNIHTAGGGGSSTADMFDAVATKATRPDPSTKPDGYRVRVASNGIIYVANSGVYEFDERETRWNSDAEILTAVNSGDLEPGQMLINVGTDLASSGYVYDWLDVDGSGTFSLMRRTPAAPITDRGGRYDGTDILANDTAVIDFDAGDYWQKQLTLTTDVSLTLTATAATWYQIDFRSSVNGEARTITWPSGVFGGPPTVVSTTTGTQVRLYYDGTNWHV